MSKISCKMRNSYAIDSKSELYCWGSSQNGLLGDYKASDCSEPEMLPIKLSQSDLEIESVSAGHFHVSVVAKKKIKQKISDISTPETHRLFKKLSDVFKEFIFNLASSPEKLIKCIVLQKAKVDAKNTLTYRDFQDLLMNPFFRYMEENNRHTFRMKQDYRDKLQACGIEEGKFVEDKHLKSIFDSKEPELQMLTSFLTETLNYFTLHPDDITYFIRLVFYFKTTFSKEDLLRLFKFAIETKSETEYQILEDFYNNIKIQDPPEPKTDYFIEYFMRKTLNENNIGEGLVFTWGISSEARLGYELDSEKKSAIKSRQKIEQEQDYVQCTPRLVVFPKVFTRITQVSCGYSHSLALSDEKKVYSWGSGKFGCCGNDSTDIVTIPSKIEFDIDKNIFEKIQHVEAGMFFSMALDDESNMYTWGCGTNGRLGHGDQNSIGHPKKVQFGENLSEKVYLISCGDTHSACITTAKKIYTWGSGSFGKLGHGSFSDISEPQQVEFFCNDKVAKVVCGSHNTIVVLTDHRLYGWGKNSHGMLGIPTKADQNILQPLEISLPLDDEELYVSEVSLGTMHSIFLLSNGSLFTCGNTVNGILGLEDVFDKLIVPRKLKKQDFFFSDDKNILENIKLFEDYNPDFTLKIEHSKEATKLIYACSAAKNTAFVTNSGDLYMCGESRLMPEAREILLRTDYSKQNKMVQENYTSKIQETQASTEESPSDKNNANKNISMWENSIFKIKHENISEKVTYLAMSSIHVVCVADKKAYSWGKNSYGVLGLSNKTVEEEIKEPTRIEKITSQMKMVAVSESHSMFLTAGGEIYSCGSNLYGKLGIGDISKYFKNSTKDDIPYELEPQAVKNVNKADFIACSNNHSACIMMEATTKKRLIYTWGSGFAGKLGHNNIKGDIFEPKKVEAYLDVDFVQLALGDEFSFALDIKGQLYGWGREKYLGLSKCLNEDGYLTKPDNTIGDKIFDEVKAYIGSESEKYTDIQYKYINASSNVIMAILNFEQQEKMLMWGKLPFKDFSSTKIKKVEYILCENVASVHAGNTHFCAIDKNSKSPYTWGSNLFFKCGQSFAENLNKFHIDAYQDTPKKIDLVFDYFSRNKEKLKEQDFAIEIKDSKAVKGLKIRVEYIQIQKDVVDENPDLKGAGLYIEDDRTQKKFIDVMSDFFSNIGSIQKDREEQQMIVENKIISVINKSVNTRKRNRYISDVPKIISQNFELFEGLITILQIHPCYLARVYSAMEEKSNFIELVKMVYGRNSINMRNKRVIQMLMGLVNSIVMKEFDSADKFIKYAERCKDIVTYHLYDLIFGIMQENSQILYEIISEVLAHYFIEILKSEGNVDNDFMNTFKNLKVKDQLKYEVLNMILNRVDYIFQEINKDMKNTFSYSVIWVFKKFQSILEEKKSEEKDKELKKSSYKILSFFIFQPIVQLLKQVIDSQDKKQKVKNALTIKLSEIVERNNPPYKKDSKFCQLRNFYAANRESVKEMFQELCSDKSEVIKSVLEVFTDLAEYKINIFHQLEQNCKYNSGIKKISLEEMCEKCFESLKAYKYDFTFNALKEIVKSHRENGNETITIPLTIEDIMKLRSALKNIDSEESNNNKDSLSSDLDPIAVFLNALKDMKFQDLDVHSEINHFVLNFTIRPQGLFYNQIENISHGVFKCENCLLPLHTLLKGKNNKNQEDDYKWDCSKCKNRNKNTFICTCGEIVSKEIIKISNNKSFFELYLVEKDERENILFEEVLCILHPITDKDDLDLEVSNAIERLKNSNLEKDKKSLKKLESFLDLLRNHVKNKYDEEDKRKEIRDKYDKLRKDAKINYDNRCKHTSYLSNINDFMSFVGASVENAKINLEESKVREMKLMHKVIRGFSEEWTKLQSQLSKKILDQLHKQEEKDPDETVVRNCLVVSLLSKKVIQEIFFDGQEQPRIAQRSYIIFEKEKHGIRIKLNYRETYRKFILCGTTTHEVVMENETFMNRNILEMRRTARHNPTFNLRGIRFNIFYLIDMIDSLVGE
jgi:alpha-tubulin suppressor-like RCC1 family protein